VVKPCNLNVRVGTPAADLIAQCGGLRRNLRKLVCGGPMMGFEIDNQAIPITKAANCLLALTPAESPDPGPALPCIRCGRCADACPASLLPQQLYWYARAKDLDRVQDYNLFDCIECGCCAHVCPSHIPLVQYYRYAKTESWAREQEKKKADHAKARHAAKLERQERQERERQAKLRSRKEAAKEKPATQGQAAHVVDDPKKAAIEAARQRAAAKKAALAEEGVIPKNTEHLAAAQQQQVAAAQARRRAAGLREPEAKAGPEARDTDQTHQPTQNKATGPKAETASEEQA
jgi:electron transport complex protein RnfC